MHQSARIRQGSFAFCAICIALMSPTYASASPPTPSVVASTTPPSASWITHEVVPGELLSEIADRYSVSTKSLIRWNKLDEAHPKHRAGQKLRVFTQLPARSRSRVKCTVKQGDSWAKIAARYGVAQRDLQHRWNSGQRYLRAGQELVVWLEPSEQAEEEAASMPLPVIAVTGIAQSVGTANRGRLVNGAQLPVNPELYTIRNPDHSYGSSHAIELLQRGVATFRQQSGYSREVLIADMSTQDGGRFGPHHSHRSGRDVDIALPLRAGAPGNRSESLSHIDWRATWSLIRAFVNTGEVKYIFLSRSRQVALYRAAKDSDASQEELARVLQFPKHSRTAVVRHSRGHTSHMHVRFKCGKDELSCIED